jgi:hypothetical protein
MLSLSDDELQTIMNLAQPIAPALRDPFLRAVATALGKFPPDALGPGLINRVARPLQKEFLHPPSLRETRFVIHGS